MFVPQQWIRVPHHHIGDVDPSKTQGRMRSQKWLAADGPQNLWGRAPRTPNWSPGDWTGIGSHEKMGGISVGSKLGTLQKNIIQLS